MNEIHAPTHATRRHDTHERLQPKHTVDTNPNDANLTTPRDALTS
jgi:hypothetical protein